MCDLINNSDIICGGVTRESREGDSCPGCLPKGRAQIQFHKRDDCFIAKIRKKCNNTT